MNHVMMPHKIYAAARAGLLLVLLLAMVLCNGALTTHYLIMMWGSSFANITVCVTRSGLTQNPLVLADESLPSM
jgi:hypothetical protein